MIELSIAIGVGMLFFLWFLVIAWVRELGGKGHGVLLFLSVVMGIGAVVAGGSVAYIEASEGRKPGGWGIALIVEGATLVLLTLIVLALAGPTPLP